MDLEKASGGELLTLLLEKRHTAEARDPAAELSTRYTRYQNGGRVQNPIGQDTPQQLFELVLDPKVLPEAKTWLFHIVEEFGGSLFGNGKNAARVDGLLHMATQDPSRGIRSDSWKFLGQAIQCHPDRIDQKLLTAMATALARENAPVTDKYEARAQIDALTSLLKTANVITEKQPALVGASALPAQIKNVVGQFEGNEIAWMLQQHVERFNNLLGGHNLGMAVSVTQNAGQQSGAGISREMARGFMGDLPTFKPPQTPPQTQPPAADISDAVIVTRPSRPKRGRNARKAKKLSR